MGVVVFLKTFVYVTFCYIVAVPEICKCVWQSVCNFSLFCQGRATLSTVLLSTGKQKYKNKENRKIRSEKTAHIRPPLGCCSHTHKALE